MGLWLLQESIRSWRADGLNTSLQELLTAAATERPFAAIVDPDDPAFLPPGDMPARIAAACERSDQRPPTTPAGYVRCIIESLALGHRAAVRAAMRLSGHAVDCVHIVGGGARNSLLCQLTADACGLPVFAGPVEATAIGNVLVQGRARGIVGELPQLRDLVATTQPVRRFDPAGDSAAWDAAAARAGFGQ